MDIVACCIWFYSQRNELMALFGGQNPKKYELFPLRTSGHCLTSLQTHTLNRVLMGEITRGFFWLQKRIRGAVGKDFVYHACGHEFESRLKWNFSNFTYHLWPLLSDYRGMTNWFGGHYNQEVRFSSSVKCKKGPQVLASLLNQRRNYF